MYLENQLVIIWNIWREKAVAGFNSGAMRVYCYQVPKRMGMAQMLAER